MFWIKDVDADLINLSHCHVVRLERYAVEGDRYEVRAYHRGVDRVAVPTVLLRGTCAECGNYRDALYLRLKAQQESHSDAP